MKVSSIEFKDFRQFKKISIKIGGNVTCIAGHNGTGKSQILALLGNCGQFPVKVEKTLQGKAFRADWGEIIKGDIKHDVVKKHAFQINFKELPQINTNKESDKLVDTLSFRTSWSTQDTTLTYAKKEVRNIDDKNIRSTVEERIKQASKEHKKEVRFPKRFRIIPEKDNKRNSEAKLKWPTYYLGMSRLYPFGESNAQVSVNNNAKIKKYAPSLIEEYKDIFNYVEDDITDIYSINPHVNRKNGAGISSKKYGPLGNSNGQDDLTQILLAVSSFEDLKKKLGDKFYGGMLLIDELDAGLHTAAQKKLLDYIIERARKLDIQIVFTTHSLDLIKHFVSCQKRQNSNADDLVLSYLTNGRGKIEEKVNPTIDWITNEITDTYNSSLGKSRNVKILTEDDTANWFLRYLFRKSKYKKYLRDLKVHLLDVSMGWQAILNLIKNDSYFTNYIPILDADVTDSKISQKTKYNNWHVGKNIDEYSVLTFPKLTDDTKKLYLEGEIWEFIKELPTNDKIYSEKRLTEIPIVKRTVISNGPGKKYIKGNEESQIKAWFKANKSLLIDVSLPYFCEKYNDEIIKFLNQIIEKYNIIVSNSMPGFKKIEKINE